MDIDISLIFGDAARWIMPVLALLVAAFCVPSLLKGNKKIGVTGYLVNEANGDRLPLSGYEVSVGRSKACDIVLGYNTVSRFHAVLSKHKNGWRVTDTRSKTGTYINAEKIDKPRALADGDTIVFGNAVFVFVENAAIEPEQAPEEHIEQADGEETAPAQRRRCADKIKAAECLGSSRHARVRRRNGQMECYGYGFDLRHSAQRQTRQTYDSAR